MGLIRRGVVKRRCHTAAPHDETRCMTADQLLRQAVRMTARDWRAGALRLLALARVIAVAAVTSVVFFVDRWRLGLERDAAQLLGADLVLSADQPIADALRARAQSAPLCAPG